jgi:hypothetical protein
MPGIGVVGGTGYPGVVATVAQNPNMGIMAMMATAIPVVPGADASVSVALKIQSPSYGSASSSDLRTALKRGGSVAGEDNNQVLLAGDLRRNNSCCAATSSMAPPPTTMAAAGKRRFSQLPASPLHQISMKRDLETAVSHLSVVMRPRSRLSPTTHEEPNWAIDPGAEKQTTCYL